MANVIYIQIVETSKGQKEKTLTLSKSKNNVMVFPLMEDLQMEVRSDIGSFSEMFPTISGFLEKATSYLAGATGKMSEGILDLNNLFYVPRWTGTKPIRFTVKLPFYTISDAQIDVYEPMKKLMALSIISYDEKTKQFSVPGIFAGALKQTSYKANTQQKDFLQSAKLVSIKIPGIIYMPLALIESAQPTFSKHLTENGFPLWGILDTTIMGLYPATDTMFNAGLEQTTSI